MATSPTTIPSSPHAKLRNLALTDTRWTRGFWADRFATCRDSMVPAMRKMLMEEQRARYIGNFEVAAGDVEGRHHGPKFDDGDFYKWFESVAAMYALTGDKELDAQMDEIIDTIGRAQRKDGYIHTEILIRNLNGGNAVPFAHPLDFEMYNMGHLMLAACVHYRATGKDTLLKIAQKTGDYLDEIYAKPTVEIARNGVCPSHLMGLVDLYRTTGEKRYLDLSVRLLDMRSLVTNGDDDNQDRIHLREQTIAHGHAVRGTYLWAGAADIYAETGDETLLKPLPMIWDDLVARKLYITGGCGALYDGASPDGVNDQETITRVHQSFGRNYQLPNSAAHNETCAAIGNVFWNWRMLHVTGESRYADMLEQTLLNGVLCGISLDGTAFFYTNTLRNLHPMPSKFRWPRSRQKYIDCYCCPPNVVRTLAQSTQYAYAKSDSALYCVLYGGNRIETALSNGTHLMMTQQTDYPWDGRIKFTIEQAPVKEFSLMLRIPSWVKDATVKLNGKPVSGVKSGTYHEIRRAWAAGDVVGLDLPMPVRIVEANWYVEEARNHVAVMRGPVVYCLESKDIPAGVGLMEVLLPRNASLKPAKIGGALDGIVALEGKAKAIAQPDRSGSLYRDAPSGPAAEIDIKLVPYFAWDNRGEAEMTVWIPAAT